MIEISVTVSTTDYQIWNCSWPLPRLVIVLQHTPWFVLLSRTVYHLWRTYCKYCISPQTCLSLATLCSLKRIYIFCGGTVYIILFIEVKAFFTQLSDQTSLIWVWGMSFKVFIFNDNSSMAALSFISQGMVSNS
jgi:hypothetical protein